MADPPQATACAAQRWVVVALSESQGLARPLVERVGLEAVALEERRFEGGEFKLRPLASVRGAGVFIVQSLAGSHGIAPAEGLLRMLLLCMGMRDAGAATVVAVIPYLAFARKDRRTQPRDPVTARYVAQLLEAAGVCQVLALDVHYPAAFDNAFRIPAVALSMQPVLAAGLGDEPAPGGIVVVSPDIGGIKRAQLFSEMLARSHQPPGGLAFIEKRRVGGQVTGGTVVGEVRGRHVLVLDDLCATGGTLVRAVQALQHAGAARVEVAVTHAPLAAGLDAVLAAPGLARLTVSDSAGRMTWPEHPRLQVLPVAGLFASAMQCVMQGLPITPLLEQWPPVPDAGG